MPDTLNRAAATEIDLAQVGHIVIVRCRIVIICKLIGAGLMRRKGIGVACW
jgi:hypothetical protein